MHVTETGGIRSEPEMIIHLEKYEVEKIQSGNPVQLNMGIGDSIHKTVEIQPEAQDPLNIIEDEIDAIETHCYDPEPIHDDTLFALETIVRGIDNMNFSIKEGNSVLEAYEKFISNPDVQNAIESYYYYHDELAEYR